MFYFRTQKYEMLLRYMLCTCVTVWLICLFTNNIAILQNPSRNNSSRNLSCSNREQYRRLEVFVLHSFYPIRSRRYYRKAPPRLNFHNHLMMPRSGCIELCPFESCIQWAKFMGIFQLFFMCRGNTHCTHQLTPRCLPCNDWTNTQAAHKWIREDQFHNRSESSF